MRLVSFFAILILGIALVFYWYLYLALIPTTSSVAPPACSTEALSPNPLIDQTINERLMEEAIEYGYTNINGPSLIKVPAWVNNPLGKYYLYFAHHKGSYIRMAYADTLTGPWTMYDGEVLSLANATMSTEEQPSSGWSTLRKYTSWTEARAIVQVGQEAKATYEKRVTENLKTSTPTKPHIASPEIYIDHDNQQIRLYFHGVVEGNIQMTKVALSDDGLVFETRPEVLGLPYMRVFKHRDEYIALSMPGILYRSNNGLSNFTARRKWLFNTKVGHSALLKNGDELFIFYSIVGQSPERILCTLMDISSPDWNDWEVGASSEVARPELQWEGAQEPNVASLRGEASILVNQLRDPFVFKEEKELYLLYTGGGEQNIGMRKLFVNDIQD